jgi:mono/diheme cytochrome c family protein
MNSLKFILIFTFVGAFLFACNQNASQNANGTANSNKTAVVVNNNSLNPAGNSSAPADELAAARDIYKASCVKCHKENGEGGVTVLDDGKKVKAPNFNTDKQKKMPDKEYAETITDGAKEDGMPSFKDKLSPAQINDLVKLIRKDFEKK